MVRDNGKEWKNKKRDVEHYFIIEYDLQLGWSTRVEEEGGIYSFWMSLSISHVRFFAQQPTAWNTILSAIYDDNSVAFIVVANPKVSPLVSHPAAAPHPNLNVP